MKWLLISLYTFGSLLAIPVVLYISFFLIQWRRTYRVPSHLPWAGTKNRHVFAKTRASMREYHNKRTPLYEGYEQYSKHGKAFVLPTMHWPDVALPPSLNSWLINQPDSVLNTRKTQDDLLMLNHLAPHGPDLDAVHDFSVITRDLTRQMSKLLPDLSDEVTTAFEEKFGRDDADWKEVELYEAIELASRRGANRMFVGLPLCRDESVNERLQAAGLYFVLCGAVLRTLIPGFLMRLVAPIVGLPFFYQRWHLDRLLRPTVLERMRAIRDNQVKNEKGAMSEEKTPNDGLQWIINSAYRPANKTFALSTSDIAGKTLLLNFFAVFTTSITTGTVLYDILLYQPPSTPSASSPSDLIDQLRAEAADILPKMEEDPTAVRRMHKLDSVIRESLRFNPMFGRGIQREVVQPGGVSTPDGLHLPQGTHVCAVVAAMQRDADLLFDADQYQPLRYYDAQSHGEQTGAVQISPRFLSFSLGKHACPGRFWAVQTMKVMLAWLLLRYEFEIVFPEGKTEVEWLEVGEARLPPQKEKGKVRVRRRRLDGEVAGYRDDVVVDGGE